MIRSKSFSLRATFQSSAPITAESVASPAAIALQKTPGNFSIANTAAGELLLMGLTAVLLRAALFVIGTHMHDWSFESFVSLRDGSSYIHLAQAFRGNSDALTLFDRRIFPGYSAFIAALSLSGLTISMSAIAIAWTATALTAVLTAVLYDDRRMGWAMVWLTPSYLMYTTMVMSEAVLLALTVGGLVCVYRRRGGVGGTLLGLAGLVRPMACFAVLGAAIERVRTHRRLALLVCVASAGVVAAGMLMMQRWNGDALQNVRIYSNDDKAYAGQLFALPFESLIMTPVRFHVPLWKVAYIWAYVALTISGCVLVIRQALRAVDSEQRMFARLNAPWLIGNTLFVLCVGHIWGFHEFHRFILPALPPLLWAFLDYYPRRRSPWLAIGTFSFAIALFGLLRSG